MITSPSTKIKIITVLLINDCPDCLLKYRDSVGDTLNCILEVLLPAVYSFTSSI